MNIVLTLSTVTLALQGVAFIAALAMSRAPGWRRVRIIAALAFTAALYSLADLIGLLHPSTEIAVAWVTSTNLSVAAAHVSAWLWYSYADAQGSWRALPTWVRRLAIGNFLVSAAVSLSGQAVSSAQMGTVSVPSLGVEFRQPELTGLGLIAAGVTLTVLSISLVEQVRQARRGTPGSRAIVGGFIFFALCGVEELLVAAGALDFIYLAEVGYLGLVVPVTAQLLDRFVADARRLASLTAQLSEQVQTATHERDAAREAFAAQERFAALGRIASGVGHEINNPLQYLMLNLEELRELHLAGAPAEAEESLTQSFEAADRIRRIVEGLRSYAQVSNQRLEHLDPQVLVESALRVAGPQLRAIPDVRVTLEPTPVVLGDEGKLVQAVVNALVNAALAVTAGERGAPRIEVRTRLSPTGEVLIEVRDNGPGYPPDVLPRLGEPFVTTRATAGGSGLGIFVTRGIVEAHRGILQLENGSDGGAVLRILLPPAARA